MTVILYPYSFVYVQPAAVTHWALSARPAVSLVASVPASPTSPDAAAIPAPPSRLGLAQVAAHVRPSHINPIMMVAILKQHLFCYISQRSSLAYRSSAFPLSRLTACDCDPHGSLQEACDPLSGQCPCRQEVSGRHCQHCRPGYFGFPHCQPCQCHGLADSCDPVTGTCLDCRDHATGPSCDRHAEAPPSGDSSDNALL